MNQLIINSNNVAWAAVGTAPVGGTAPVPSAPRSRRSAMTRSTCPRYKAYASLSLPRVHSPLCTLHPLTIRPQPPDLQTSCRAVLACYPYRMESAVEMEQKVKRRVRRRATQNQQHVGFAVPDHEQSLASERQLCKQAPVDRV